MLDSPDALNSLDHYTHWTTTLTRLIGLVGHTRPPGSLDSPDMHLTLDLLELNELGNNFRKTWR